MRCNLVRFCLLFEGIELPLKEGSRGTDVWPCWWWFALLVSREWCGSLETTGVGGRGGVLARGQVGCLGGPGKSSGTVCGRGTLILSWGSGGRGAILHKNPTRGR